MVGEVWKTKNGALVRVVGQRKPGVWEVKKIHPRPFSPHTSYYWNDERKEVLCCGRRFVEAGNGYDAESPAFVPGIGELKSLEDALFG